MLPLKVQVMAASATAEYSTLLQQQEGGGGNLLDFVWWLGSFFIAWGIVKRLRRMGEEKMGGLVSTILIIVITLLFGFSKAIVEDIIGGNTIGGLLNNKLAAAIGAMDFTTGAGISASLVNLVWIPGALLLGVMVIGVLLKMGTELTAAQGVIIVVAALLLFAIGKTVVTDTMNANATGQTGWNKFMEFLNSIPMTFEFIVLWGADKIRRAHKALRET